MKFKQKLAYIVLGCLLVFAGQLSLHLITNDANAQGGQGESTTIKYVYAIDYPLGEKGEYLQWVSSVVPTLSKPNEVKRIVSYDNYYGTNPHRIIEWEFANIADAMKYWQREEIRQIGLDIPNHSSRASVNVFVQRGDYTKQ